MDAAALTLRIKTLAENWGADVCACADLDACRDTVRQYYGDRWDAYHSAISISVNFPRAVLLELQDGPTHAYLRYYDALNTLIDTICFRLNNELERQGYAAYPIPASQMQGGDKLASIFNHRLAAHQAGVGWIGKNCSLIRPDRGPAHRLGTVLTSARLTCGTPLDSRCGDCRACADACPAHALRGVELADAPEREERFEALLCQNHLRQVRIKFGKEICGSCIAVCPWARERRAAEAKA